MDFPGERLQVQTEQVQTRKPVSESLVQTMAGSINHMLLNNYATFSFKLNGSYKGGTTLSNFDGYFKFFKKIQIIGATIFNGDAGTSGTTEVDILAFPASGGVGTSIFSTRPAISSSAPSNSWISTGETVSGCTAPVLTSTPLILNANFVLQAKLLSAMGGNPKNLQVEVYVLASN